MKKTIAIILAILFALSCFAEINDLGKWGYETEPSEAVIYRAEVITNKYKTDAQKIYAIIKWVRTHFMYPTVEMAKEGGAYNWYENRAINGKYIPDVDKFVTNNKINSGVCIDYAVTGMTLLRAAGYDAYLATGYDHMTIHAVVALKYNDEWYQIDFQEKNEVTKLDSIYSIIKE